jgi:DNA-binding NarL/FixJ family response regulator
MSGVRSAPKRIAVIDRQPLFLEAVTAALAVAWPDAAAESHLSAESFLERNGSHEIELVVCDIETVDADGPDALANLMQAAEGARVIAFSSRMETTSVCRVLTMGVRGYLPKTVSGEVLRSAVSFVLAGGTSLLTPGLPAISGSGERPSLLGLRGRELEVLEELERGASNKLIARRLGLSLASVKLHVQSILRATGARNRVEAIASVRRLREGDAK